jgi:hypothetical protein
MAPERAVWSFDIWKSIRVLCRKRLQHQPSVRRVVAVAGRVVVVGVAAEARVDVVAEAGAAVARAAVAGRADAVGTAPRVADAVATEAVVRRVEEATGGVAIAERAATSSKTSLPSTASRRW